VRWVFNGTQNVTSVPVHSRVASIRGFAYNLKIVLTRFFGDILSSTD